MISTIVEASTPLLEGAFRLIDQLYTTEEERNEAKYKLLQLEHEGKLAQIAVNKIEAAHASVFVAGWRPGAGWVCVLSLFYALLCLPVLETVVFFLSQFLYLPVDLSVFPRPDLGTTITLLLGMLGLSATRAREKEKHVARESLKNTPTATPLTKEQLHKLLEEGVY